ncbi:hypothetical protein [Actinoplanes lobatus]|uniref:Uncharacterized protein n=1 Tax=Actinoplanes lobatus TaxID=113568 RepID=A0A7W7MDN9_9ACTN|nr:hypothetical protein [Actinoplanes lobatus]MBB4745965.1 hypothetical protein [Actinoplanes lobatus]
MPGQHGAPGQNGGAGHPAAQRHSAAWAAPDPAAQEGPTQPLGTPHSPSPAAERAKAANEPTAPPEAANEDAQPVKEPKEPRAKVRKTPRRATVALAVLLSLLALAGSVAAVALAWRTKEVKEAKEEATPGPAPERPDEYRVSYAKEPLRIQLACAAVLHLDLDEPRADAAENLADLRYESRCGTQPPQLSLGPGAAGGSRHASADTDAEGCDRAIRTSPLGQGLRVEVAKGTALCVLTAATPAELVLVEIVEVGGSGSAGLRATSWQMPTVR